jgi:hypothetical protein
MTYEHFYWFVDRKATDSVLRMPWKAFLECHPWKDEELRSVLEFAVEPTPGARAIRSMLDTKTLAWTVSRSEPALYVVNEIVEHVPALRRSGGTVEFWDSHNFESLVLNAVAARAFLDGRITPRTLRAVFAIHGEYVLDLQFDVPAIEPTGLRRIERAISAKSDSRPLFSWLGTRAAGEGYHWLREADTDLFGTFIQQAWAENWPMLPLDPEVADELELKSGKEYKVRNFPLARRLAAAAKKQAGRNLCLVRYFELEVL